jgi:hypothetical protein
MNGVAPVVTCRMDRTSIAFVYAVANKGKRRGAPDNCKTLGQEANRS